MIDVVWMDPSGLDQRIVHDLLENKLWTPVHPYEFRHVSKFGQVQGDGAIVVLPGAYHRAADINRKIKKLKWVLVIVVSDERSSFAVDKLRHPNMKVWVQNPYFGRDYGNARFFGDGYADARDHLEPFNKDMDIFLSAQDTHERRHKMFDTIEAYCDSHDGIEASVMRTRGFTQGLKPADYYHLLSNSKIAPAPSGTYTPDSFRVYEALEVGAIPIADDISPIEDYNSKGYWAMLFPDAPFPIIDEDSDMDAIISYELDNFNQRSQQIFAWWQQQKRKYAYDLQEDIEFLTFGGRDPNTDYAYKVVSDRITAIIPVSPWKSHPDTSILEETIRNTQTQLPGAEIIVTFDGVREEQEDRRADYELFVSRMLHIINSKYHNVLPLVFSEHTHQVGMAREAMKFVRTESIIYIEGDSPLYPERHIPWDDLLLELEWADANVIRLYNKAEIPPEHEYLMMHENDIPTKNLIATGQWSQQPHLANANFYREILDERNGHFTKDAKCFIEEKIYYIIANESRNGQWRKWRMFIYVPDNQPRSYHLDGRAGEPKWEDKQVF